MCVGAFVTSVFNGLWGSLRPHYHCVYRIMLYNKSCFIIGGCNIDIHAKDTMLSRGRDNDECVVRSFGACPLLTWLLVSNPLQALILPPIKFLPAPSCKASFAPCDASVPPHRLPPKQIFTSRYIVFVAFLANCQRISQKQRIPFFFLFFLLLQRGI